MGALRKLRNSLLISGLSVAVVWAQGGGASGTVSLQQELNEAQELQRQGRLDDAAARYRIFIAEAVGQLAMGYGSLHDYAQAAPLFDEALELQTSSTALMLEYAQTALELGDPEHARSLGLEFVRRGIGNRQERAQAHQVLGRAYLKLSRFKEARRELEEAVALDPTFPNGYDLAVACLDLGDGSAAEHVFSEMQASYGDTAELHMAFGRAYAASDLQPKAVPEFQRAIEKNPRLPGAHYLLAAVLMALSGDESHLAQAQEELQKELVNSPHDAMSYAALGKIALTRGKYAEAEADLKQAIASAPENPDPYLYLGQVYVETNRAAEGEAALRQSIRLTTEQSRNRYQVQKAHFLLGRLLMKENQQAAAHAEMEVARELADKTLAQDKSALAGLLDPADVRAEPGSNVAGRPSAGPADAAALRRLEALKEQLRVPIADSYNNLGAMAASSARYPAAVSYFKRAAIWNPSLDGLDYNWGRAAFAGGRYAEAIMPLTRYVKTHPEDVGGRSALAISDFMTGDYPGCIQAVGTAAGAGGLAPQVELAYAESLVRTGQADEGARRLSELEKANPEMAEVHRAIGEMLRQRGTKAQAMEELRAAIRLSPRDAEAHFELGSMELEEGAGDAAIKELEAAVQLAPDDERFHLQLAHAYRSARRADDAEREMQRYRALKPHDAPPAAAATASHS